MKMLYLITLAAFAFPSGMQAYQIPGASQDAPASNVAIGLNLPKKLLKFKSGKPIPGLPNSPAFTLPPQCTADGTLFLDAIKPSDPSEHTVYSIRANEAHTFNVANISDLHDIQVMSVFPSDSMLGILVLATRETSPDKMKSAPHSYFVAEFQLNGNYLKSVELPLHYRLSHIAILSSGDFLVGGYDITNQVARLSLLNRDGKLKRSLDFPAARLRSDSTNPMAEIHASETLLGSVLFTSYAGSVLVWRSGSNDPILDVQSDGSVREVPIQAPNGFVLADMVSSNDIWVAHFRRNNLPMNRAQNMNDPNIYRYYEMSPSDGSLSQILTMPENDTGSVYCENDGIYTSFEINHDNKFVLLTSY